MVSSNALMLHMNPMLLCEPEKFVPEIWMADGSWWESGGGSEVG